MVDFDWLVAVLWTGEVCCRPENGLCLRFFGRSRLLYTKELVGSTADGKKILLLAVCLRHVRTVRVFPRRRQSQEQDDEKEEEGRGEGGGGGREGGR